MARTQNDEGLRQRKSKIPQIFKVKSKAEEVESPPETKTSYVNRALIALFLVVPWVCVIFSQGYTQQTFVPEVVKAFDLDAFMQSLKTPSFLTTEFGLLLMSLSTPHVYYHLIWIKPASFHAVIKKLGWEPYKFLAKSAHLIKITQLCLFINFFYPWLMPAGKDFVLSLTAKNYKNMFTSLYLQTFEAFLSVHLFKWIFFAQTMILGQILNLTVYQVLGEIGVYYGARLGQKHRIQWVTGFPYNTLSHGQYLGAMMTIVGTIVLLATPALITKGIYVVALTMATYYGLSSYSESNF